MQEIFDLIDKLSLTGKVEFSSRLVCKMSPHSQPTILFSVSKDDDFNSYSQPVINTIIQRLKIMIYENSKNK